MNIAVLDPLPRDAAPSPPTARQLMARALDPYILLGMPHLTPFGLSETWLMKELGHRHWIMLALHLGMDNADFRTTDGREAYASICATSLTEGRLHETAANDVLEIRSSLMPLSRSQYSSRHWITGREGLVCEVEIVSAFVTRRVASDNHSLIRADQAGGVSAGPGVSELALVASHIRRGTIDKHLGLPLQGEHRHLMTTTPDVREDFNGAGLFYFANFQAFFARALNNIAPATVPFRRDVFFLANLQPLEAISVFEETQGPSRRGISCTMTRPDGRTIARSFLQQA